MTWCISTICCCSFFTFFSDSARPLLAVSRAISSSLMSCSNFFLVLTKSALPRASASMLACIDSNARWWFLLKHATTTRWSLHVLCVPPLATEPSRRLLHLFGTVCRSQYAHRRHCKFFAADWRPSFLPGRTAALTKSVSLHWLLYRVTSLLFLRVTCPCSLRTYATLKFIRSSSSSTTSPQHVVDVRDVSKIFSTLKRVFVGKDLQNVCRR